VQTQKHGGQRQPMAFLSKFLDPVTEVGLPAFRQCGYSPSNRRK
jgi:hypothetical protein